MNNMWTSMKSATNRRSFTKNGLVHYLPRDFPPTSAAGLALAA